MITLLEAVILVVALLASVILVERGINNSGGNGKWWR